MIDFDLGDDIAALRTDVRAFLDEELTAEVRERVHETGTWADRPFSRALGGRGWVAPIWPIEEGGAGKTWLEQLVIRDELDRAAAPVSGASMTMLVAKTIRLWGTPELKERVLGPAARGEIGIVLGYSEADAGSDVAAVRTRAVRDGDEWVVNGEKMFTTHAHVGDYVFLLTRTDPDGPKRKNLTLFLVPMTTPGISVAEVRTLGGERTNITSYVDVRVPDAMRVGEVNGGWAVLGSALQFERFSTWGPAIHRLVDLAAEAAASTPGADGRPLLEAPAVRARLARAAVDAEVSDLLALRAGWAGEHDPGSMVEGPAVKLFSTEAFTRASSDLLELFGPAGLRRSDGPTDTGGATELEHDFRHSQVTTIYGGTSEVQRSIIAERGLGLPRSRSLT